MNSNSRKKLNFHLVIDTHCSLIAHPKHLKLVIEMSNQVHKRWLVCVNRSIARHAFHSTSPFLGGEGEGGGGKQHRTRYSVSNIEHNIVLPTSNFNSLLSSLTN
uniref:Putative ovule protein n=1 Tax=Solanum chacoense TaxID=4108 RepID=A0A0V0HC90_SOLCH